MSELWHNFKYDRLEERSGPPQTDEEAREYIPQDAYIQRIYTQLRAGGLDIENAVIAAITEWERR